VDRTRLDARDASDCREPLAERERRFVSTDGDWATERPCRVRATSDEPE